MPEWPVMVGHLEVHPDRMYMVTYARNKSVRDHTREVHHDQLMSGVEVYNLIADYRGLDYAIVHIQEPST